jgi:Mrp family chromosome partitioning ATPase
MSDLLTQLRATYDVVLVDCPPLLPVTDPMVVSQLADGVLLIARAGATTKDEAAAAKASCVKAGVTVFGTVLNATSVTEGNQPGHYAYYGEVDGNPAVTVDADPRVVAQIGGDGSQRVENGRAARHLRVRSGTR